MSELGAGVDSRRRSRIPGPDVCYYPVLLFAFHHHTEHHMPLSNRNDENNHRGLCSDLEHNMLNWRILIWRDKTPYRSNRASTGGWLLVSMPCSARKPVWYCFRGHQDQAMVITVLTAKRSCGETRGKLIVITALMTDTKPSGTPKRLLAPLAPSTSSGLAAANLPTKTSLHQYRLCAVQSAQLTLTTSNRSPGLRNNEL
ncbi:hypothetical protein V8F20_003649 [Naviculisporaceae sp. PSN 640]